MKNKKVFFTATLAWAVISTNAFAVNDLLDSWNMGVIDSQNKCVATVGGGSSCMALTQLFAFGSAKISPEGKKKLRKAAKSINLADNITIVGHTDSIGQAAYNLGLSERRAISVKNFLMDNEVDAGIDVVAMGESEPVADNQTEAGRALNRRVEISY